MRMKDSQAACVSDAPFYLFIHSNGETLLIYLYKKIAPCPTNKQMQKDLIWVLSFTNVQISSKSAGRGQIHVLRNVVWGFLRKILIGPVDLG